MLTLKGSYHMHQFLIEGDSDARGAPRRVTCASSASPKDACTHVELNSNSCLSRWLGSCICTVPDKVPQSSFKRGKKGDRHNSALLAR